MDETLALQIMQMYNDLLGRLSEDDLNNLVSDSSDGSYRNIDELRGAFPGVARYMGPPRERTPPQKVPGEAPVRPDRPRGRPGNFLTAMGQNWLAPVGDEIMGAIAAVNPFDEGKGYSQARSENLQRYRAMQEDAPKETRIAQAIGSVPPIYATKGALMPTRGATGIAAALRPYLVGGGAGGVAMGASAPEDASLGEVAGRTAIGVVGGATAGGLAGSGVHAVRAASKPGAVAGLFNSPTGRIRRGAEWLWGNRENIIKYAPLIGATGYAASKVLPDWARGLLNIPEVPGS